MTDGMFAVMMPWGRVGSNLVIAVLGEHGRLAIANEPTTALRSRHKDLPAGDLFTVDMAQTEYLRQFPDIRSFDLPHYKRPLQGMKLSHRSLISPMLAYSVMRDRGFRIVAMDRKNHIKSAISQIRAEQGARSGPRRGRWVLKSNEKQPGPVVINPGMAVKRAGAFASNSLLMAQYLAHFFPKDRLDVLYEDLNADPQTVIGSIADFLGITMPAQFSLPHKKATSDDLSQSVANWDEVRAAFADSAFADLLTEC